MNKGLKSIIDRVREFMRLLRENHVDAYSSNAAFFIFLSIIPFLIVLFTLIPYTPLTKADLLAAIVDVLPNELDAMGINIMDELYGKSPAVLSISAIAAVWSAARGILAITKGLNEITQAKETRNYFIVRFWSAFYTLFLIAAMVVLLIGGVFGERIHNFLKQYIIEFPSSIRAIFNYRDLIMLCVLFFLFLFFYTILPDKRMKIKRQIPGAVFSSITWVGFSGIFSIYITNYNSYSMYGSLAAVVIVMLWLYAVMYLLFIGAQINYCLTFR